MSDLAQPPLTDPLLSLHELGKRARHATSPPELRLLLVNDTAGLVPYRQAALWQDGELRTLSGSEQIEADAPYARWLAKVCAYCAAAYSVAGPLDRGSLPPALATEWSDWLPEHAWWQPLEGADGGLLLAREGAWFTREEFFLAAWSEVWCHAWGAQGREAAPTRPSSARRRLWRRPWVWAALAVAIGCIPVRLTIFAPAELVPARPEVVRAPLEGVIAAFHVEPNQPVKKGQPLFSFDPALLRSRLEVAQQAQAITESEYRQAMQQALVDARARAQLPVLTGRIEEKRAETEFLEQELARAQVLAPADGVALFDDPSGWIGRPVTVGERILRVAVPEDLEVEAWVGLADAIPLPPQGPVTVYLDGQLLAPVQAQVRYLSHEAVARPGGSHAYRLRATLREPTPHRVGLKGTARVDGERVPLAYWVLRRPLAGLRTLVGW